MRSKLGGRWLAFEAEHEAEVARVGFTCRARVPLGPLASIRVVDAYSDGAGRLRASVWGVPLARAEGVDAARGQALRYLAELPWVPHAMLANAELAWRELGTDAVEGATSVGGTRVTLRMETDVNGDILRTSTQARPRIDGGTAVDTAWGGVFSDYRTLGGIRIPTRAEVCWEPPEGAFAYWRGRVTALTALF